MFKFNYLLFSIFIIIFLYYPVNSNQDRIVKNFLEFSTQLQETFFRSPEATEIKPGVQLFNDFGVAYSLANIQQGLWNISSKGVPSALRTVEKYIAEDYGHLIGLLKKSNFKVTSTIYSRYGNVTNQNSPSSFSTLMSHLIHLDYVTNPASFVDSFSNVIDTGTKGHLDNELLPKGLWQKVFDNRTQGAFVNTLYYKGKHPKPWTEIGQKLFNLDANVTFLEAEGVFPFFQNENITAVIVDIQQKPQKQIILCKSHRYLPTAELQKQFRYILQFPLNESFVPRKLRIQLPALNVTNLSRHNLGLTLMGINETFCQVNATTFDQSVPDFVQQPIAQANHFEFAAEHIEISSATGSIVSLNTGDLDLDLEEEYNYDELSTIIVKDYDDSYLDAFSSDEEERIRSGLKFTHLEDVPLAPYSPQLPSLPFLLRKLKLKPPSDSELSLYPLKYPLQRMSTRRRLGRMQVTIKKKQDQMSGEAGKCATHGSMMTQRKAFARFDGNLTTAPFTVTFDSPFAFILQDQVLGESFSGFVSSLCFYNKVVNAVETSQIHAWLQDVFKVAFWKCY